MTSPPTPLVRRRRLLLWAAGGLTGLAGAGLAASTRIKSPAQLASESGPPAPTVLTAPVERRILRDSVVFRGTVIQSYLMTVAPTSAWGAERVIVTGIRVKPGDVVKAGQVIAEVSGRPVIVLPGAVPAFRDLRPGAAGKDITQLQRALRGLGYTVRSEAAFGPSTKSALTRLYGSIGYPVPDTGEADNRAVREARAQVNAATLALQQAEAAPAPGAVEAARATLTQAKTNLADLVARTGAMLPLSEVVFAPSFPVRVVSTSAVPGREIQGSLAVLATGAVVVGGTLTGSDPQGVARGQPAQILVSTGGQRISGKVDAVGSAAAAAIAAGTASGGSGQDGSGQSGSSQNGSEQSGAAAGFAVVVRAGSPLDPKLVGQSVRITVTTASTEKPVLVVPVAAISARADAAETVTAVDESGAQRVVRVTVGRSGAGYIEIVPVDGALEAGQQVLVGVR